MRILAFIGLFCVVAAGPLWSDADMTRPSKNGEPTEVRMSIFVIDVDSIDTVDQSFQANVFFLCRWNDPRLAHHGKEEISRPLTEVWNPRIQFINQQRVWSTFPEMVEISPEGEVSYRQRVWGSFSQPLSLRNFPFDKQDFNISLYTSGYNTEEIKLVQDPATNSGIAPSFSVADWTVFSREAGPQVFMPGLGEEDRASFVLTFMAKRQSGYFVVKVILPLIFIVAMSWVVFWIDPAQAGSQINLAMTAMLTLIAYRFATGLLLPKFSYLTRLDYFILYSTILVFASLVEVVATSTLAKHNRLKLANNIDRWCRVVFPLAFFLLSMDALFFRLLF